MNRLFSARHGTIDSRILPQSLRSGKLVLVACTCAALFGTGIWQLWQTYDADIRQAQVVTSNTARSIAEQAETTIKTADAIAATLVERIEAEGTGPEARGRLYHLMTSLATLVPAIHDIAITDSKGDTTVKSFVAVPAGMNYVEEEFFRSHTMLPDRAPFVGGRIKSKEDGTYDIIVSRRINRSDGGFAGVAVATVSLQSFQQLFDQLQAKAGSVITLLADDDTSLAGSPSGTGEAAKFTGGIALRQQMRVAPRAGSVAYKTAIDGARRYGSYQRLRQYPLSILVSLSEWDLQRSWRVELGSLAVILTCVMIVMVVVGGRALKANSALNALVVQDGLTGLATRRVFDKTVELELRRATRSGEAVSIIMIDIDHFKDYNDCYGHPAGDDCLRAVAHSVQGCLRRAGDVAARYGGEEIAVILPGVDAPRAYAFAERIRLAVRGLALQHARSEHGIVTFSAGVATFMPGRSVGAAESLVGDADAALYLAKATGRDTVATCPPSVAICPEAEAHTPGFNYAA
jgi:diguanylate cyclase (GGDEF)-like protein